MAYIYREYLALRLHMGIAQFWQPRLRKSHDSLSEIRPSSLISSSRLGVVGELLCTFGAPGLTLPKHCQAGAPKRRY
jgi:hypothetical protein